jgi:hypothetical protein
MGVYLNPGCLKFREGINSDIYVDKTQLIAKTNSAIGTKQKYICVSRPRRFGKTMATEMLAAYYGIGNESKHLFEPFKISLDSTFQTHLNKYHCLLLNMQNFLTDSSGVDDMLTKLSQAVSVELSEQFPEVSLKKPDHLIQVFHDIYQSTSQQFIILIDEWDCLFRVYKDDLESQKKYLDFLRFFLKDQEYVGLAYMTGILPIKKYGSHSALNMFSEYSMIDPRGFAPFFGFTEQEVAELCAEYGADLIEAKAWYDGYQMQYREGKGFKALVKEVSLYSPKSLVDALSAGKFGLYWNKTETYEALKIYIQMNFDGLKDAVITMLSGGEVPINTDTFINDMSNLKTRDDVLTLLVHLGYLSYDESTKTVTIPNKEIAIEFENAIQILSWDEVTKSIRNSKKLLEAAWSMEADVIARGIDQAHQEVSILQYNDENALSYTIALAFYYAREYYTIIRELPTGKGFADMVMIPRQAHPDKPALVIELKWNQSTEGAISQIKQKNYPHSLEDYQGNMLLIGINYDKKTKVHECEVERLSK